MTEMISFTTPAFFRNSGFWIFLVTTPTNILFPKGTETLVPFLIFILKL